MTLALAPAAPIPDTDIRADLGKDSAQDAVIIIPARHASVRFPGKPLAAIRGAGGAVKPLVQWSHEAALAVSSAAQVWVATDDDRIAGAVSAFGGKPLITPQACANGTERIAACLDRLPSTDLFVNLQGDALLTPPSFVDALIAHMVANPDVAVGTVAVPCTADTYRHLANDATEGRVGGTTVVLDAAGNALYFSKRILPYLPPDAGPDETCSVLLHLGLYAYRRQALRRYLDAGPTMLEAVEGLEQLRFLVHGIAISVLVLPAPGEPMVEVNNPADVPIVEKILGARLR